MQNSVIVTGGDARYYPLIAELIASIHAVFPAGAPDIAVFDAGLEAGQCDALRAQGVIIKQFIATSPLLERPLRQRPALGMNFAKLWLDQYFPDHEIIICIDADAWVQDRSALDFLYGAARTGALAIVPMGGAYRDRQLAVSWVWGMFPRIHSFNYKNAAAARLPRAIRNKIGVAAILNAGVFALPRAAPHWQRLRYWQERVLRHGNPFTADQLSLGLICHIDGCQTEFLPARCNYTRKWRVDPVAGKLLDFYYPYPPVGIVHMADQKQIRFDPDARTDALGMDGRNYRVNLRFGHLQRTLTER